MDRHTYVWITGAVAVAVFLIGVIATLPVAGNAASTVSLVETDTPRYWVEVDGVKHAGFDDEEQAREEALAVKSTSIDGLVTLSQERVWVARHDSETPPAEGPPADDPPADDPPQDPPADDPPADGPPQDPPADDPPGDGPPPIVVAPTDLVWGYDDTPPPGWDRPDLLAEYIDPTYNTTVRRMTSADGTRFNRNTYSRRQAENADGTLFMTYHGTARYHVYDTATGDLVRDLDIHPDSWPQWHPTDPNLIRHNLGDNSYKGDLQLWEVDVRTGRSTVIADLTARIQAELPSAQYMHDRAEGSPSVDGNRWAFLVYDSGEDPVGMVSYDLAADTVHVLPAHRFARGDHVDWTSASPTGAYVMAGHLGTTWVYDFDLTNPRMVYDGGEHSDIALGPDGGDVYVYIDFSAGPNGGWLMSTDLDTLDETRIFDLYEDANTSIHISGKGYDKPGWVVASTYSCKSSGAWSCHKVMAVELAPQGRVLNLAHTNNCGDNYWTETHAVVNRSFTRVYFNSDSGSCGIDAEVFRIDVPPFG